MTCVCACVSVCSSRWQVVDRAESARGERDNPIVSSPPLTSPAFLTLPPLTLSITYLPPSPPSVSTTCAHFTFLITTCLAASSPSPAFPLLTLTTTTTTPHLLSLSSPSFLTSTCSHHPPPALTIWLPSPHNLFIIPISIYPPVPLFLPTCIPKTTHFPTT